MEGEASIWLYCTVLKEQTKPHKRKASKGGLENVCIFGGKKNTN